MNRYAASSYAGDPKWMRAKYPGIADDGTSFRKGDEILYWPRTKTVMVGRKAEEAWRRFQSEVEDEDFYNMGRYASADRNLRSKLIRLAHARPDLRPDLLRLLMG